MQAVTAKSMRGCAMSQLKMPLSNREAQEMDLTPDEKEQMNRDAAFPTRLRALRKRAGLSQPNLAAELGVATSTVLKFEQGDTVPDAKVLARMSDFFGVSFDYLLCATNINTQNIDVSRICKKTGLSEAAVMLLAGMQSAACGTCDADGAQQSHEEARLPGGGDAARLLCALNRLLEDLAENGFDGSVLGQISAYIGGDFSFVQADGTVADHVDVPMGDGTKRRISDKAMARDYLDAVIAGLNRLFKER